MRPPVTIAFAVLALMSFRLSHAQDNQATAEVHHLTASDMAALRGELPSFPVPVIPAGRDGWAIEIVTAGGFTGRTMRDTIDSAGSRTCARSCGVTAVSRRALSRVAASAKVAVKASWPARPAERGVSAGNVSVCNDCLTTRLSLWYRDRDGAVRVFRAQWNTLGVSALDPAVRELYERAQSAIRP
jgi:hypothetical protein